MASIEGRPNGSYRITVSDGYDSKGNKIRHKLTIPASDLEGLTGKQKEKELNKKAVLFEEQVRSGSYLDGEKITFADFIERWLKDYAKEELAPSTLSPYIYRLENRIIPALGHITLAKLQPHHLHQFYNNLKEEGVRNDLLYQASEDLKNLLEKENHSKLSKEMGVYRKTFNRLCNGKGVYLETAEKICDYYKMSIKKLFEVPKKHKTLSYKIIRHHHTLISTILATAVQ